MPIGLICTEILPREVWLPHSFHWLRLHSHNWSSEVLIGLFFSLQSQVNFHFSFSAKNSLSYQRVETKQELAVLCSEDMDSRLLPPSPNYVTSGILLTSFVIWASQLIFYTGFCLSIAYKMRALKCIVSKVSSSSDSGLTCAL